MELEFDKEIDSLLHKTGEAERGVLVGDKPDEKPKVHLDADEISAFAENAMPEKTRALYLAHFADCDRCRRILSGLIALSAEAEPVEDRVVAPVISSAAIEPRYRRLLLPNLAYIMGGLVLVFGGLIAFTVLQSSNREAATVSQAVQQDTAGRGPMADEAQAVTDQMANSNAAFAANKPAMAQAANTSANAANAGSNSIAVGTGSEKLRREAASRDQPGYSLDGADAAKPTAAAPAAAAPPPPTVAEKTEITDSTKSVAAAEAKDDDQKERSLAKKKVEDLELNARQVQDLPRTQAGGLAKATPGPSRDNAQNFPNRANNTSELFEEKRISGKGFQRRNNVWYDNSYRGQATTNVRRGTDEYRNLDSGLRSIAESLNGVVVVMWSGKAYRIQ